MDHEELTIRTSEARNAAWATWGDVDDLVFTHLISPMFMGGPKWPSTRQAFRPVRRPGEILLASDGLADPDDDDAEPERNGLEHEFYAITADPLDQVPGSWLFDLVWQMSQFAAGHGGLAGLLDEMTLLSTELYDVGIPDPRRGRFVNSDQRVAILLGLHDSARRPRWTARCLRSGWSTSSCSPSTSWSTSWQTTRRAGGNWPAASRLRADRSPPAWTGRASSEPMTG